MDKGPISNSPQIISTFNAIRNKTVNLLKTTPFGYHWSSRPFSFLIRQAIPHKREQMKGFYVINTIE